MRNYCKKNDKNKFIKSYSIVNEEIIAKLATGEKYKIPYTENNKEKIENIMKEQIENAKITPISIYHKFISIIYTPLTPIFFYNVASQKSVFHYIIFIIMLIIVIYCPSYWIWFNFLNRDIEKNKIYLENEMEFNKFFLDETHQDRLVMPTNKNLLIGVSRKTIRRINKCKEKNELPIHLNNLDSYSLEDLIKIKDNIKRISNFYFEEYKPDEIIKKVEKEAEEKKKLLEKTMYRDI